MKIFVYYFALFLRLKDKTNADLNAILMPPSYTPFNGANLNKIHRSKSRESPKRQLPKVTQELASSRGGDSDDDIDEVELSWQQNVECSTQFLSEFENSAPPPLPKRSNKKKATKKVNNFV